MNVRDVPFFSFHISISLLFEMNSHQRLILYHLALVKTSNLNALFSLSQRAGKMILKTSRNHHETGFFLELSRDYQNEGAVANKCERKEVVVKLITYTG